MMTKKSAPPKYSLKVASAFEGETRRLRLENIQPLHIVTEGTKKSPKYRQVQSSIREIGLVEPPVVTCDKGAPGKYFLVDGHLRVEVLRELNVGDVECLIATDDEAYTYNKRISRIAVIQEHLMMLKAIDQGVSEEKIAKTMNVNIAQIRLKKHLLKGICPEAVELLKDRFVPVHTFTELRKMLAVRQVEAVQLMIAMNKFSVNYARSLVGATPRSQLIETLQSKKVAGLTDAQMALMEQESISLDREVRLIKESYGADNLDLVVAVAYVNRLLENARVVRYLAQNFPELLAEFQKIAEPEQIAFLPHTQVWLGSSDRQVDGVNT